MKIINYIAYLFKTKLIIPHWLCPITVCDRCTYNYTKSTMICGYGEYRRNYQKSPSIGWYYVHKNYADCKKCKEIESQKLKKQQR